MVRFSRRFVSFGAIAGAWLQMASVVSAQSGRPLEQGFAASLMPVPHATVVATGSFYVPAYSSVAMSHGKVRADFSVTLSVHNTSNTEPLILTRVAYFDTAGRLVENYLVQPVALKPLATVEVYVPASDVRGGTGANFVVDWSAAAPISEPVVEALMIGSVGAGHYSFISQGRALKTIGP